MKNYMNRGQESLIRIYLQRISRVNFNIIIHAEEREDTIMQTVRVLMVLPNLRVSNGVTNFVMNYYRGVDHKDINIDFATLSYRESPYLDEVKEAGSKVFILPSVVRKPIQHLRACRRILKEGRYDIIHVNTLNQAIPILLLSKKTVRVRILHSHSTGIGESRIKEIINKAFLPILLKLSNCYSACSTNAGTTLFGEKPFVIIPNVIVPEKFKHDKVKRRVIREREETTDKKIIGTVGRLAEPKNPLFSMKVIEAVIKQCQAIEYWWIGSGPLDSFIKQYVQDHNLSEKVRLFGSRDDISDLYQAMDLFFLPSRFEGFGLACIEAQAAGLPCVVSTEFPPEIDVTGNVKFIALDEDITSWSNALIECLDKGVDEEAAYEACVRSNYSEANSGHLLVDYYYKCLNIDSL